MAILFVDGFDHYATGDINKKWDGTQFSPAIVSTGGRRNSGYLALSAGSRTVTKNIPLSTTIITAFAVRFPDISSSADIIEFFDGSTVQVTLRQTLGGPLVVYKSNNVVAANEIARGGFVKSGIWHHIEVKLLINNTVGTILVKVDGETVINATGLDTQTSGASQMTSIRFNGTIDLDDMVILDTTGGAPQNDMIGDVQVDTLYPNGDGNHFAFSTLFPASPTIHSDKVNETPVDEDTTYVQDGVLNDRDSYAFDNLSSLPGTTTHFGVQVVAWAKKTDSGTRNIRMFTRPTGTNFDGTDVALAESYEAHLNFFPQDEQAVADWTDSTINATEFGIQVR